MHSPQIASPALIDQAIQRTRQLLWRAQERAYYGGTRQQEIEQRLNVLLEIKVKPARAAYWQNYFKRLHAQAWSSQNDRRFTA